MRQTHTPRPSFPGMGAVSIVAGVVGTLGLLACVVLVIWVVSTLVSPSVNRGPTIAPTATLPTVSTGASRPAGVGDGIHVVGTTLPPGTYHAPGSSGCYWARLSGFGGSGEEIIANHFGSGPVVVTIAPTDKGFRSSGCGAWTKAD